MLRPSRPMMRPFISSDGRSTTETVLSTTCSEAMRWIAIEITRRALSLAFSVASSSIRRIMLAASIRASCSMARISSALACSVVMLEICSRRVRCSATAASSRRSTSAMALSRTPSCFIPAAQRGFPAGQLLDPAGELALPAVELPAEAVELDAVVTGLALELGARRQQALPHQDLAVLLDPLAVDFGPRPDPARFLLGVGEQAARRRRGTPARAPTPRSTR